MPQFTAYGITVDFPVTPYPAQEVYMERVLRTLSVPGNNGVLESPTGTGKTLCLLCAALAWQNQQPFPKPKIIYTSRTHSQLAQVAKELRKTVYAKKTRAMTLGSRDQLCVNAKFAGRKGALLSSSCRSAVKNKECVLYAGLKAPGRAIPAPEAVLDIEDLRRFGERLCACPFYYSRENALTADLIFCPYNYLLEASVLTSLGGSDLLKNSVILVDEGHNLEKVCEDAASAEFGHFDIANAIDELQCAMGALSEEDIIDKLKDTELDKKDNAMTHLTRSLLNLEQTLARIPLDTICPLTKKFEVQLTHASAVKLLSDAGFDAKNFTHFSTVIDDALEIFASVGESRGGSGALESLQRTLTTFFSVANSPEIFEKSFRAILREGDDRCIDGGRMRVLSVWCFTPAVALKNLVKSSRNLIITSGTLSPLNGFKANLEISLDVELQNSHVINPQTQLFAGIVSAGPSGVRLNSSMANRSSPEYLGDLGSLIVNVCRIVPEGVLVAFHSYSQMDQALKFWYSNGTINRLDALKQIFQEPKASNELPNILKKFGEAVTLNGAILFCVCRGKITEGTDLSDRQCRAVIVAGLPFPSLGDKKVILKKSVLETRSPGEGQRWYFTEALRAVNQTIGRAIRHKDDFGAILLCDERFVSYVGDLPSWVTPTVKKFDAFGSLIRDLATFFKSIPTELKSGSSRVACDDDENSNAAGRTLAAVKKVMGEAARYTSFDPNSIKSMFANSTSQNLLQCKLQSIGNPPQEAKSPAWLDEVKSALPRDKYETFRRHLKELGSAVKESNQDPKIALEAICHLLTPFDLTAGLEKFLPSSLKPLWGSMCSVKRLRRI